jgi:hypothetical protein
VYELPTSYALVHRTRALSRVYVRDRLSIEAVVSYTVRASKPGRVRPAIRKSERYGMWADRTSLTPP